MEVQSQPAASSRRFAISVKRRYPPGFRRSVAIVIGRIPVAKIFFTFHCAAPPQKEIGRRPPNSRVSLAASRIARGKRARPDM